MATLKPTLLDAAVGKALADGGGPSPGQTIVAALSGGPDSVALLDALVRLSLPRGFRVVAAHLDHGLRAGSAADAEFCRVLCRRLGVPLRTGRADVKARARREHGGLEEAGRHERYRFLRAVRAKEGAAAIAVAHTLDDQAETFLLRLLRGSGRAGLTCMRRRSGDLLRPLLGVSRGQVRAHLEARELPWREDPTNADPAILRNRVRAELLPQIESRFNPAVREVLARTATVLGEEADLLAPLADELVQRACRRDGDGVVLSLAALRQAPRALGRLALRQALKGAGGLRGMRAGHVESLLDLAASPASSGRRLCLPGGREALFRFDGVRIGPRSEGRLPFVLPLAVPGRVELPGGLTLVARAARGPAGRRAGAMVVGAPEGPLVVRTRRPGDRVRTPGREVSLKRFLMEQRVPADLRGGLPLVASGRRVLWVAGQEVAAGKEPEPRFVRLQLLSGARGRVG